MITSSFSIESNVFNQHMYDFGTLKSNRQGRDEVDGKEILTYVKK